MVAEKHNVLFGAYAHANGCELAAMHDACVSASFTVTDKPIMIQAFGLEAGDKLFLEMVAGPNQEHIEAVRAGCGSYQVLTCKNNTLCVPFTGTYRLNRCFCVDPDDPDADTIMPAIHVEYVTLLTPTCVG
jgi:hypothetical protein